MPRLHTPGTAVRLLAATLTILSVLAGFAPLAGSTAGPRGVAAAAPSHAATTQPVIAAAPQTGETHFVRQLPLVARDLVVHPTTQTIYASLPSTAGLIGNSIAPIDPATGSVGQSVFMGSEPNALAISDDGQFIYASLEGAASVRRFDVATATAGPQFYLGNDSFDGPVAATDLAVAPGSPQTLAVYRRGGDDNVSVYDDGVRRNDTLRIFSSTGFLAFGATASRLYAYIVGDGLRKLSVTPSGVVSESRTQVGIGGEVRFVNGLLYTAGGSVINPEAGTLAGSFTAPGINNNTAFAVDANAGRAYFLTSGGLQPPGSTANTYTLRAFDLTTFVPVGSFEIQGVLGSPASLVRWGANGLAFVTSGRQVFILQTTLVPSPEPVPTPTPTPTATPTPGPTPTSFIRQLTLPTQDIIYNPSTQRIYASVPSRAGAGGNSITPVDPVAGTVGQPVFVGSEPGRMALTDDGQFIYVGLTGATAVRRFDVATGTAGPQFTPLTNPAQGPDVASDLDAVPGAPGSVAVMSRGVSVYDGGVRRPDFGPGLGGSIQFSDMPSRLYSSVSSSNGATLHKLDVDGAGVRAAESFNNLLRSSQIVYDRGRLYAGAWSSFAQVFDPETATLLASFRVADTSSFNGERCDRSSVVPDPLTNRVFYLCSEFATTPVVRIKAFDAETFLPLGTINVGGVTGDAGRMVRWGVNGLAFRTTSNQLFLVESTLVSAAAPVPTPTPTTTPTPIIPPPTPTPAPGELRQLALTARDLVVDPATQTVFASVPSSAGANSNSVTPIDPVAGTAGPPIAVGSDPGKMAISDNGQYLYVALNGESAVRRLDVATRALDIKFSLGTGQFNPLGVGDMAVAPGQPGTVAIARTRPVSPSHAGVAIYDDGVRRPLTTPEHTGSDAIEYSSSPEVLYGHNLASEEGAMRKMLVASCGVSNAGVVPHGALSMSNFRIVNGLAYTIGGRVFHPEQGAILGTFTSPGGGLVVPEPSAGRVYFVEGGGNGPFGLVRVFDSQTYLPLGELRIPGIPTGSHATSAVRWGANGLAFSVGTQVFLLQHALIGGPPVNVPPAPPPIVPTLSAVGFVQAIGGGTADIDVTGAVTTTITTGPGGQFAVPGIPPCAPVTLTPRKENYTFTPPSVTFDGSTPIPQLTFFTGVPKVVRFTQSAVNAAESSHFAEVTVTRGGDASAPAAVEFETAPAAASDRSDFTAAFGTLRFAAGERNKTLRILLDDDVLVEGTESFVVRLKNPVGALLAAFDAVTVNIGDNDTAPPTVNPLEDASFFVRRQYHDFLNREPDAAGLAFWADQIVACTAETDPVAKGDCLEARRINVSAAFFLSIEFQETGYLAYRTHKAAFGDLPGGRPVPITLRDFLADSRQIGAGVEVGVGDWAQQLEANKNAYAEDFVRRPRFLAAHPDAATPAEFVDALNANADGALSQPERDALVNALTNGTMTRAQVLRAVAEDDTLKEAEFRKAFVLMQYFGYLRRDPDAADFRGIPDPNFDGWRFWLTKLNDFNGNFVNAEMVKAFIISLEYTGRFGPTNFDLRR